MLLLPKSKSIKLCCLEENILAVLHEDELSALQLADVLSWNSNGRIKFSFGTLCPKLRRLERLGFVKSRWSDERLEVRGGNRSKYYLISSAGVEVLRERLKLKAQPSRIQMLNLLLLSNRSKLLILVGLMSAVVAVVNKYSTTSQALPVTAQVTIASHTIGLEVSQTQQQQAIGLMYRTNLSADRGMLFEFQQAQPVRF